MEELRDQDQVVVFTSHPSGAANGTGDRSFTLDADPTESVELELDEIRHEDALVKAMQERGFQLTMVGGGSRKVEVRRFYFRLKGS